MTIPVARAFEMVAAAHEESRRRSVRVSAAVVDAGGNLVAFGRMDGAEIAGPTLAVDKAYTAVSNSIATSELAVLAAPGGELFGLHANGNGRFVIAGRSRFPRRVARGVNFFADVRFVFQDR